MYEGTTYYVGAVPIAGVSVQASVELILDAAHSRRTLATHLCNAFTVALAWEDSAFRDLLCRADVNLPDGSPVAWLGRRHGVRGPVRGATLVEAVIADSPPSVAHYFYGAHPGVAARMAKALSERYPNLRVAGVEAPPFEPITDESVLSLSRRVQTSGADVVWVGLGTPKQDYLVDQLVRYVSRPIIPVGAAFNFLSGQVRPAPTLLHGSGLEWLYRFAQEPRRLWKRYTVGNIRFLRAVLSDRCPR